MAATATASPVLPVTDARSWDYGDGRTGLTWATPPADGGEHYGTSVSLRQVFGGVTEVTREGKGDRLRVHLDDATRHVVPVVWTDHRVVAYLGAPAGLPVAVQTAEQYDAAVRGEVTDRTEYPDIETALVDLAFYWIS